MKKHSLIRHFFTLALALGTFAFFFALAFPHFHDESNLSDQDHSCLVCKIQKSFSSTDVIKPAIIAKPKWAVSFHLELARVQKVTVLFTSNFSRAPPTLH
jgi:hypothetical protein